MIANKKIGPLISIVTVVHNDVANIEETILSVINQNYENIEYIIIDGESNDGTVDIIRKFESSVEYWISEPDKGIYYAMNKGADIAKGDFITFMNSGDRYLTMDVFDDITEACFIPTIYRSHLEKDKWVKLRNKKFSIPYCHQGIVFKNMKIKYDIHYKYAADYDYFLRHGYDVLPFSSSGKVFYDNRGLSSNSWGARKELSLIIKKNFGFYYGARSFFLFSLKYVVIKLIYFFK